jgi:hypothetical protein
MRGSRYAIDMYEITGEEIGGNYLGGNYTVLRYNHITTVYLSRTYQQLAEHVHSADRVVDHF